MHSDDKLPRRAAGGLDRTAKNTIRMTPPEPTIRGPIKRKTHQFGPVATGAVIAIVVVLLFFAATRWLPPAGTSTATSAVTTPSVEQPDNGRSVTPNPLIPKVVRRSTPPNEQVSDLPPNTEILPPPVTVPESVDIATTDQQLDLREIENAKRVQQRLIDLGFLFGAADGIWGSRSRRALQEFKVADGLGDNDTWDEGTQERLFSPNANAASTSDIGFIGGWGVDVAQCRESPLTITAQRAEAFGAACEFRSTQRESSNVWRLRALCTNDSERWNANIRFTLSGSKLTWSSERGTTTYVRCPS